MENINTKDYWESRFITKNWGKSGNRQTKEYAKANVAQTNLDSNFKGSVLDFGCALGDAIPIYHQAFPDASLYGMDLSEVAIEICKNKYGDIAKFESGTHDTIKQYDLIFASHVMEHLTADKTVVAHLLTNCKELFVFVPYKESPLYREHVNYYERNYYDNFEVLEKKVFLVQFEYKLSLINLVKSCVKGKFSNKATFSKDIIMFRINGAIL
ncbi:class I SAM-dependent methyltransferase [Winogradskyella sp. UBA3174]|uniref:class I SAM-dependent methyltransferase n=1 Tax=Winogradskyella sp. UBA3174 TaxID=1947785 RepID=UPI0025CFE0D5|nr:class I SAM-dependent methyltransferase [Winogradskyella sp. UBA3174]